MLVGTRSVVGRRVLPPRLPTMAYGVAGSGGGHLSRIPDGPIAAFLSRSAQHRWLGCHQAVVRGSQRSRPAYSTVPTRSFLSWPENHHMVQALPSVFSRGNDLI